MPLYKIRVKEGNGGVRKLWMRRWKSEQLHAFDTQADTDDAWAWELPAEYGPRSRVSRPPVISFI